MMSHPAVAAPSSAVPYVAPFLTFIASMALEKTLHIPPQTGYPLRCLATLAVLLWLSRGVIDLRASKPVWSIVIGIVVFVVWVGPDLLLGHRGHWLFQNSVMGEAKSTLDPALRSNPWFLAMRSAGSFLLVPVIEELFWRSWMMRWLISYDFYKVRLGTYTAASFWITAALFASEHGPYWEVGLAAGVIYGWWMIRTRNLADCILAHAVTNAILAAYAAGAGQWQYWL